MEWMSRAVSSKNSVSPADLKICDLCGALNHEINRECFTCGWRGLFVYDPAIIELAWRRLVCQHEGVLLEHVTSHSAAVIDEFGHPRQTNGLQRLTGRIQSWWRNVCAGRRMRVTPRADLRQPTAPSPDL